MSSEHFYVITGASGAGKSTLLKALRDLGYSVVPEIALAIVQEQEQCGGDLLPWTNLQAFMEEVLARNILAYDAARALPSPVFFDRGIPECLAHMELLGLEISPAQAVEAAKRTYANRVFVAEPWPDIYVCDRWRRAPFERAARSFEPTVAAYTRERYSTCVLPQVPVEERAAFVLEHVGRRSEMRIETQEFGGKTIAVVRSEETLIRDVQSALDLMATVRYEADCDRMVLDKALLDERFFDLSTRLAGDILQKFINYRMKVAIVGDFSGYPSTSLRDFIYESNQGRDVFFQPTLQAALERLGAT